MMLKNEIKILLYKYCYYNFKIKFIYKNTMEDNTSTIEMLLKSRRLYKNNHWFGKITAVDKTADVLSSLISRLTVSIVFCVCLSG
jgi:hypothetical protein